MCVCVCVRTRVCVCVHTHTHLFIYSYVDGYIGCFCILIVVDNAAVNIREHMSFQISVWGEGVEKYPEVELLDCMVPLIF